jgi:hypothetical protein
MPDIAHGPGLRILQEVVCECYGLTVKANWKKTRAPLYLKLSNQLLESSKLVKNALVMFVHIDYLVCPTEAYMARLPFLYHINLTQNKLTICNSQVYKTESLVSSNSKVVQQRLYIRFFRQGCLAPQKALRHSRLVSRLKPRGCMVATRVFYRCNVRYITHATLYCICQNNRWTKKRSRPLTTCSHQGIHSKQYSTAARGAFVVRTRGQL